MRQRSRLGRRRPKGSAGATTRKLLVGLPIAISVLSLAVAYRSYRVAEEAGVEAREVILDVRPSVSIGDLTDSVAGIRVTVVNESLRRVVIPAASLWLEDCRIGDVEQWLPNAATFDRRFLDANWADQALPLPITVAAREGSALALLVPYKAPCLPRTGPISDTVANRSHEFEERFLETLIEGWHDPKLRAERNLRLVIDVAPGGRMVEPLEIGASMTPGESWQIGPRLMDHGTRFLGIDVRRKLGDPGQASIITVEIWREDAAFHDRIVRPVIADESTIFRFGMLSPGHYAYVVRAGQHVISGERFRIREA